VLYCVRTLRGDAASSNLEKRGLPARHNQVSLSPTLIRPSSLSEYPSIKQQQLKTIQ
jgi:hypothetical protein